MDARPEIPDPQHDEHVAFPEAAAPPASWWEPTVPPPGPPLSATPSQRAAPSAKSVAWWAIAVVFLFGTIMSGEGSDIGASPDAQSDSSFVESPGSIDLIRAPVAPSGDFVAEDPPLYGIPPGTQSFHLEVVSSEASAGIDVRSANGAAQVTSTEEMPYAGEVRRGNPNEPVTVTVLSTHDRRRVQCRVYLGDALVAIGTGDGTATCEVPATR